MNMLVNVDGWVKWNTDAFNIEDRKTTTIAITCRDDLRQICHQASKHNGYRSILLVEAMTIREAFIETIKARQNNVILQSDSLVVIRAILGK